ncbi:ArsC family reductase [Mariprofundus sp. EBB-1]|uniref:ArsC family reductase n=1 Tax=Mariprofundus sp. EBB-1 TaxID=2650971 RepID=UPI000EF1F19E|nr:ArsC family reductase [Mariprofundus sp. EBB-1]RLL49526.1 ArsC family reductase [Mariprofundus sp. EBB-1]
MTTMYGIPNCDTIKKARRWLDANDVAYQFHNYKKDGITPEVLEQWVDQLGWEALLNKRGTTWRKLPDALKHDIDRDKAIALMCEHTSMIKRPVLIDGNHIEAGFSDMRYQALFA